MSVFTPFYDSFMDDSIYKDWQSLMKRLYPNQQASLLDLACGTARLSIALATDGFKMEGLDISEDMLIEANANQVESGTEFPLYQMDMRELDGLGTYEGIICSLDSMCYVETFEDVETIIQEAYIHLDKEGYFIFDVHSLYKLNEVFPGFQYHNDLEKDTFLWTCYLTDQPNTVVHEMNTFIYNEEIDAYDRYSQDIYEYGHEVADYLKAIKGAGFSNIDVLGDGAIKSANENSERLYFICKK